MNLLLLLIACGPQPAVVLNGLSSPNPTIREGVVTVARNIDDPSVTQALIHALNDPSITVRAGAAESLGIQNAVGSVQALLDLLEDPEAQVRRAAVDALGQIAHPDATLPLIAYVEAQETPPLNALWALGEIGDSRSMDLLDRLRGHQDPYVSFNADCALQKLPMSAG